MGVGVAVGVAVGVLVGVRACWRGGSGGERCRAGRGYWRRRGHRRTSRQNQVDQQEYNQRAFHRSLSPVAVSAAQRLALKPLRGASEASGAQSA
jgi:hypothetical protein